MLEAERQRHQPRIAISQSQEPYTETVLRLVRVCLFKSTEPLQPQFLNLVIGFACEPPKINFLIYEMGSVEDG